jgi:hypothetical protein
MPTSKQRALAGGFLGLLLDAPALAAEPASAARQASDGVGWSYVGIAIALVALVSAAALVWAVRRFYFRRREGVRNDPRYLLHELCQAHGLSRRAERLLRTAAAEVGTPHAGRFFLEPKLLREALRHEKLRGSRRALGLLYEQLFGDEAR